MRILIGLAARCCSRALRGVLFGVSAADPVTLVPVAVLLTAVAVAAAILPVLSAARVDPARVLNQA